MLQVKRKIGGTFDTAKKVMQEETFFFGTFKNATISLQQFLKKSTSVDLTGLCHCVLCDSACVPVCSELAAAVHRREDALLHTWPRLRYISRQNLNKNGQ